MYDCLKEMEVLKEYVRPVTKEDKKTLPTFSHSKIEVYDNCPYKYSLQYEQGKRSTETTLALELGKTCHKVLERANQMWKDGNINYDDLLFILKYGIFSEKIIGTDDLKKRYFEDWYEEDSEGHDYQWKMENFTKEIFDHVHAFNYNSWFPFKEEYDFEFVFNNRAIFKGFIDSILINTEGDLKCIDYKTSKKQFLDSKVTTSQQFGIYCMAILNNFDKLPVQCDYEFILLNETQNALTDGFGKRIVKMLNSRLDKIEKDKIGNLYTPKPSPLCWYCPYNKNNPKNKVYPNECKYYSLWTPNNKIFDVANRFNVFDLTNNKDENKIDDTKRKLIF